MWNISCHYCKEEITGCCYPAYEGTVKVGYRHINCYPENFEIPLDYERIPYGHVIDDKGELD